MRKQTVLALVIGLGVFFVEGVWLNQGFVGLLVALGVGASIFVLLLRRLFGKIDAEAYRQSLRRRALVVALSLLGIAVIPFNTQLAAARAQRVIAACESFKAKHGRYPDTLVNLTPEFLPSVPKANLRLAFNEFIYMTTPERHLLIYTVLPPFDRRVYDFEERNWRRID